MRWGSLTREQAMRKQIAALIAKAESVLVRAEELADSDNDDTAAKYDEVTDAMQAAIAALEEALEALN